MTALQVFGCVLLASPFIAIIAGTIYIEGWRDALRIWGFAFGVVAVVALGAALATGWTP